MNALSPEGPAIAPRFAIEVSFDAASVDEGWAALEAHGSPFQARAWVLPWRRVVAPRFGAAPLYVTVRDAATGRAVMFLPLCRRRWRGLATIEFPDLGVSDYNAPLLAPDFAIGGDEFEALWGRILDALPRADIMRLDKVPAQLGDRANPLARLTRMRRMALSAWLTLLPATRDDYEKQILDRKARKEHRRKRARLAERLGDLSLVHAATPCDREAIFAALMRQRSARFRQTGRCDLLADSCFNDFYRAVAFESGSAFVDLAALKAGDMIVATLLALRGPGAALLLMHAFEPTLDGLSPGIVAIDELVSELIASGARRLDFTIGDEAYKRQFGVRETPLVEGLYPLSWRGRLYAAAQASVRACRRIAARLRAPRHGRA